MDPMSSTKLPATQNQDKPTQISCLSVLLKTVIDTCRSRHDSKYSFGNVNTYDTPHNTWEIYLDKLAQFCDTQKGGNTVTALALLQTTKGPLYVFCSNNRNESELEATGRFLSDLLVLLGPESQSIGEKALQKQVLWRAIEFGVLKVTLYLRTLIDELEHCIHECIEDQEADESEPLSSLESLHEKATFCEIMDLSDEFKNKSLKDCESLIKAIHVTKQNGFAQTVNSRCNQSDKDKAYHWCQVRHYLGRLHSYRQASETIVEMSRAKPELFGSVGVSWIPSAGSYRFKIEPTLGAKGLAQVAFPNEHLSDYENSLEDLKRDGLEDCIQEEIGKKNARKMVHAEILLHDFLVKNGDTQGYGSRNSSIYIATSKPPCRLCHFYFQSLEGEQTVRVQPSHMNLYPKWRLPDSYLVENVSESRQDTMDEIIEYLQADLTKTLRERVSPWRRNDSRTDSRAGMSTRYMGSGASWSDIGVGGSLLRSPTHAGSYRGSPSIVLH